MLKPGWPGIPIRTRTSLGSHADVAHQMGASRATSNIPNLFSYERNRQRINAVQPTLPHRAHRRSRGRIPLSCHSDFLSSMDHRDTLSVMMPKEGAQA